MADRIRLLPEVVANQIAAGEVVHEPASVVKEMMENAVDAGASRVQVNFRDGGKELVQIVDDGCGMSPADARLAFDRHATSKIRTADDLYALTTFGFRGEALASIAAVAQVELRTRQHEDELGTQIEMQGGCFADQRTIGCPPGTQFFVRNLFFNMPARRRSLKKSSVLAKHIRNEFRRVALCHPEVAFELYADDAPLYRLEAGSMANRIVDLVGGSIKQNLLEVEAETSIASLKGYIGRPSAARQRNEEQQYLFVNGRYFQSAYLVSAILRAYEKLIPATAKPSYFLFFTIDPSRIDVNIHPQKTEVHFADEEAVWQILHAAVRETLAKSGAVPMMDFESGQQVDIPVLQRGVLYDEPRSVMNEAYNPFSESYIDPSAPDPNTDFHGFDVPYENLEEAQRLSDLPSRTSLPTAGSRRDPSPRSSGELFREIPSRGGRRPRASALQPDESFLPEGATWPGLPVRPAEAPASVLQPADGEESFIEFASSSVDAPAEESGEPSFREIPSGGLPFADERPEFRSPVALGSSLAGALTAGRFVVIDLRRACERIAYDRIVKQLQTAASVSQQLLFPEQLAVSDEEFRLLEEQEVELAALGFDIRFAEGNTLEVHGIPADLPVEELEPVLFELMQRFAEPFDVVAVRRERLAAVLAAATAKSAPRNPSSEELAALLERLAASTDYTYSPAGKPILAEISVAELRARLG